MAPLRFATMLGLLFAAVALLYGCKIIYETLVYGERVPGYPSLFVGVMVLGGVQLIMLGVLGEYIGKVLYEIKGAAGLFRRRARREGRRPARRKGRDAAEPAAPGTRTAAE